MNPDKLVAGQTYKFAFSVKHFTPAGLEIYIKALNENDSAIEPPKIVLPSDQVVRYKHFFEKSIKNTGNTASHLGLVMSSLEFVTRSFWVFEVSVYEPFDAEIVLLQPDILVGIKSAQVC